MRRKKNKPRLLYKDPIVLFAISTLILGVAIEIMGVMYHIHQSRQHLVTLHYSDGSTRSIETRRPNTSQHTLIGITHDDSYHATTAGARNE